MTDWEDLVRRIEASWHLDTTFCPDEYAYRHPSYGQCGVTAILLQERYGGDIKFGTALYKGERCRHYWNYIDGEDVDLTRVQFRPGTLIRIEGVTDKETILCNPWFQERYRDFCERVRRA